MDYINIKTPAQLYEFMRENIKYGFYSTYDNKTHTRVDMNDDELYEKLLFTTYSLQTPEELLNTKFGICYDQVELERKWFEDNGYKVHTYYTPFHNHCFLVFVDENGYNWFERTIKEYNGIHTEKTKEKLLEYYKNIQLANIDVKNMKFYEYDNVKFHCNFDEFINNIKNNNS